MKISLLIKGGWGKEVAHKQAQMVKNGQNGIFRQMV